MSNTKIIIILLKYLRKRKYVYIRVCVLNIGQGIQRINRLAPIPVCNSFGPLAGHTSMKENARAPSRKHTENRKISCCQSEQKWLSTVFSKVFARNLKKNKNQEVDINRTANN